MLIGVFGGVGSGKTLLVVIMGSKAFMNGKSLKHKIVGNFWFSFGDRLNPLQMLDFEMENTTVLLSEAHTFLDSRNSSSQANKLFGYFFTQSRKRNVNVLFDAQLSGSVDIRLRDICTYKIYARKDIEHKCFTYWREDEYGQLKKFNIAFDKAKWFYPCYNTYEIIYPLGMDLQNIDFEKIKGLFMDSPNKKGFTQLLRNLYPFVTLDSAMSCYDFLKVDKDDNAKRCLGIRKGVEK